MSLNVYLYDPGANPDEAEAVFDANVTHNLNSMAAAAGVYEACWRPGEIGATHARDLLEPLQAGLRRLLRFPTAMRELNPPNGWGNYEGLVRFVNNYLQACKDNPDATIRVSR